MDKITFGVMTDLHTDQIHNGRERLAAFVSDCRSRNADFMIQLGDFVKPHGYGTCLCPEGNVSVTMRNILEGKGISDACKDELLRIYSGSGIPAYHVLGNHDLDLHSKEEIVRFWGMPAPWYSMDIKGYHFVVLDLNYGLVDGKTFSFDRGNYLPWCFRPEEPFPILPQEELAWLDADLAATDLPTVIFSHEGLCPGFLNAKNTAEISAVLKKHADRVRLCIYGHKHQNLFGHWDGIPHYCVNSMSGYSLAPQYAAARFDAATEEQYPNLRYIAPYRDPLYVIVTMDGGEIRIDGRTSSFLSPTPAELGVTFSAPSVVLSAEAGSVVM